MSDKLKIALEALKEIRETQKGCDGCEGDCMWCHDGTGHIFETADNAIKEIEKDVPAIDLNNRTLEIIIKAHLPGEIQTNSEEGVRGLYEKANKLIYDATQIYRELFGSCECSMEVKAGDECQKTT